LTRRIFCLLLILLIPFTLVFAAQHGAAGESHDAAHQDNATLWKAVNFVILMGLLLYFSWKPAAKYFRSRTEGIRKGIVDAGKMKEEAEARAAEMERRLATLDDEIARLRESAREEMAREEARLKEASEKAVARMRSNTEYEIASVAKHARNELREYAADLALKLARTKIRDRMSPEVSSRLVDSFVTDLGRGPRRVK